MDTIRHLETKFSIASYELIKHCEAWELRFYLWLKLWAINKSSAFPGVKTIATDLGYSERQVQRMIKEMEDKGRLLVSRRDGLTSVYDISFYDRLLTQEGVTKMSPGGDKNVTTPPDKNVTLTNRNITNRKERITNAPAEPTDIENLLNERGSIQYDWQFLGLELFDKTNAPANKKSECMRLAKKYPSEVIMNALSFAIDHPISTAKWKMFLWKLNSLVKNGQKNNKVS
jgi:AraC-like DNA-binding protein